MTSYVRNTLRVSTPYIYGLFLIVLIPVAFALDTLTRNVWEQDILGVLSLGILIGCTRFSPPIERRQVWIMVAVATCVEIWSSVIWGIYRYRFHNMPLFIPWGHGLVYLFALRAARTPLMLRYGKVFSTGALTAATAWMVFGLTIEPLALHRLDLTGALFWPLFVWFMRKPSAPIYAAAFFVTSYLELIGTHLGNWTWAVYAPVSHMPTGNPPSVISAGYCIMDFTSLAISARLGEAGVLRRWWVKCARHVRPAPGSALAEPAMDNEMHSA
ncbi:MAG: hypothetical protein NVS2B16_18470 [Chloroflexota bacterium]